MVGGSTNSVGDGETTNGNKQNGGGSQAVLWNLATPGRRYRVFEAAPQGTRGMPAKKPVGEYFL